MRMSMTAFARTDGETADTTFSVEIRSVNHRFLDIQTKLPESLRALEPIIRQKCQQALYRGKIEVYVSSKRAASGKEVQLNPPIIKRWLLAFSDSGAMESLGKPDWATMLTLPGVMLETAPDAESLHAAVLEAVDHTIAGLLDMRSREGEQITAVLLQQLDAVQAHVCRLLDYYPQAEAAIGANLRERLQAAKVEVEPARFEQELVLLLSKADVREELDRLQFHVNEARKALAQHEAVGRRMDFLMQEFNREANTLGSKAADNELSKSAVELKVIIEQMREQVQNLE